MKSSYDRKFQYSDFMILLLSYIKLSGIEKIDVEELGYALADLYDKGPYCFVLKYFDLRKTTDNKDIVDIDGVLMDAYILGYMREEDQDILLKNEFIKKVILTQFNERTKEILKGIADYYVDKVKIKEKKNNFAYLTNLFKSRVNSFRKKNKKSDE